METNSSGLFTGGKGFAAGSQDPVNPYDNKPKLSTEEQENAATQTISGKYNSVVIAKNLSMEISQFNRFNPDFDNRLVRNGQFDLVLPADKMQLFLANKYQILNECVQLLLADNPPPASTRSSYTPGASGSKKKKRN
jgi:hypothetical protein